MLDQQPFNSDFRGINLLHDNAPAQKADANSSYLKKNRIGIFTISILQSSMHHMFFFLLKFIIKIRADCKS